MHYLHRILVYIPDVTDINTKTTDRNEFMEKIRYYAEQQTEPYYLQAFDWRDTDSAGRWDNEYPVNVIFAEDDVGQFVQELEETMQMQHDNIQDCLTRLGDSVGTDLEKIVDGLLSRKAFDDYSGGMNCMTPYYLYCIAAHLHGEYRYDSYFFNTSGGCSNLFPEDIEAIKEKPQNWALVMFDYHN